jgi:hypothetical protein
VYINAHEPLVVLFLEQMSRRAAVAQNARFFVCSTKQSLLYRTAPHRTALHCTALRRTAPRMCNRFFFKHTQDINCWYNGDLVQVPVLPEYLLCACVHVCAHGGGGGGGGVCVIQCALRLTNPLPAAMLNTT